MDNKKIISISTIIMALAIGYYFVIFLPQKFSEKQQKNNSITKETFVILNECLASAKNERDRLNEQTLKFAREENKDAKYDLSGAFESIERIYIQDREDCFKKYPQ